MKIMNRYKGGYQIIDLGEDIIQESVQLNKEAFSFLKEYYNDKNFEFKPLLIKFNLENYGKIICQPVILQETDMIYLSFTIRDVAYNFVIELGESLEDTDITIQAI